MAPLEPYRGLRSRGLALPQSATDGELAKIFITPGGATPKALIDSLDYVDEMATPKGIDT
ncbi:MAG: hypothetical protein K6T59_06595 [Bryobacteraceae bacterium]|nr:hypothetical protein [Bryobacteraceae bacterium]